MVKITDYAKICSASPRIMVLPKTTKDIIDMINKYPNLQISIAGGKYSHGGQTLLDDSIYLDMQNYNKVLKLTFNKITNEYFVTVQSGIKWIDLIKVLDKYDLSVSIMQSYYNFSIGGSVSVNCHGRSPNGTLAETIIEMKILTIKYGIMKTNRYINYDLFRGVIGGYGGIGIILEVTLRLELNYKIKRYISIIKRNNIQDYLKNKNWRHTVFYNGNIYPKNEDYVVNIEWKQISKGSEEELTNKERYNAPKSLYYETILEYLDNKLDIFKYLRANLEPKILKQKEIVYRNKEIAKDPNMHEPITKIFYTNILQEYFLPIEHLEIFQKYFWNIMNHYKVNLLNVSLRYVKKTDIPILNYAPSSRIGVVIYLNMRNNKEGYELVEKWSQLIIDILIKLNGSYYLPYLPVATKEQFRKIYPNYLEYLEIKKKYDPTFRLMNNFLKKYIL